MKINKIKIFSGLIIAVLIIIILNFFIKKEKVNVRDKKTIQPEPVNTEWTITQFGDNQNEQMMSLFY